MNHVLPITSRVLRRFLGAAPVPELPPVFKLTADEMMACVSVLYGRVVNLWFMPSENSPGNRTPSGVR